MASQDNPKKSKKEELKMTFSPLLDDYLSKLRESGNRGVDRELRSIAAARLSQIRSQLAPPVDWELLTQIVPETFAPPGDIDPASSSYDVAATSAEFSTTELELAASPRSQAISSSQLDVGLLWYGDWYDSEYRIISIPSEGGTSRLQVAQSPPPELATTLDIDPSGFETTSWISVAMNVFGESERSDSLIVETQLLENSTSMRIRLADGEIFTVSRATS